MAEFFDDHLSTWGSVAEDVVTNGGYALVRLGKEEQQVVATAFQSGRHALEIISSSSGSSSINSNPSDLVRCIGPTDDSAHATGYHPSASSNSMSRYNEHREGFVFSDGNTVSIQENTNDENAFGPSTKEMQDCLHSIANQALRAVEQDLDLSSGWFQEMFDHHEEHSQWHLKRYTTTSNVYCQQQAPNKEETEEIVLLPSHTDPSLLSVVILDAPGIQSGAMGLQLYQMAPEQDKRIWTELPCHGYGVAIIFVGSVLSHILGGKYPSAKHRVVQQEGVVERMAATFFLRPKGSSILQAPPSPALEGVSLKKKPVTFDTWSSRVSRNYMKRKKKSTGEPSNGTSSNTQQQAQ